MKKYLIPLFFVLLGCGEHSLEEWLGGLSESSSSEEDSSSSSSRGGGLSSSSVGSGLSSSSIGSGNGGVVYGADVSYQGETYQTVVIGTQTWFQRNLNYAATGSKCGDGNSLSDANTATCDTYGRLYNWATAMKLPASCNTSSCSSSIGNPHQGICPTGWHIPSNADWDTLMTEVGGSVILGSSIFAGKYLKATSGWANSSYGRSGNGTDDFGFTALPGGNGDSGDGFLYVGYGGYWWSASEKDGDSAYHLSIRYFDESAGWYYYDKDFYLMSIRCVKD